MPKLIFHKAITTDAEYDRVFQECLALGMTGDEAAEQIDRLKQQTVYIDETETYQVAVQEFGNPFNMPFGDMVWLSIKRKDRECLHDFRVMQEIKNALVGEECEAFEVYPAESRLVDTSNQYHLWAFKSPTIRIPIGFQERLVMPPSETGMHKQRPFEDANV